MKIKDLQNIYTVFDILHWNLFSLFTVHVKLWISMWLSQIESLIDKFFTIQFSDCHSSIQENLLIRKCLWHMTRYEDVGKIITSLKWIFPYIWIPCTQVLLYTDLLLYYVFLFSFVDFQFMHVYCRVTTYVRGVMIQYYMQYWIHIFSFPFFDIFYLLIFFFTID